MEFEFIMSEEFDRYNEQYKKQFNEDIPRNIFDTETEKEIKAAIEHAIKTNQPLVSDDILY